MNFARGIAKWFVWTGLLLCCARLGAELPQRKIFQFGEYTIEASVGDEVYVEALAKKLADYRPPEASATSLESPRLSVADLAKRKDYFLQQAARQLGLAQPTERMKSVFGQVQALWADIGYLKPRGIPRRFAVWRKSELIARIDAGEKIPNFSKQADGMVNFSFNWDFNFKPELTLGQRQAEVDAAWEKLVWPVKIDETKALSPEQDADASLAAFRQYSDGVQNMSSLTMQRSITFNVLHETVEAGVVWHYLTSKDRRWFCDGVANYVAWKMIQAEVGPEEARGYYDLPAELAKYTAAASSVDLAAWPAAEDLKNASYREDLNTANYAFATQVIAEVCAKHGDSILPRLFTEIGKTPREKATMDTVYRAFKKLTREDLRAYLPKPGSKR